MNAQSLNIRDVLRMVRAQAPTSPLAITPREEREMPCRPSGGEASANFLLPEDMDWISDMRDIDLVKASMRNRIHHIKTYADQKRISTYCEDVAIAFHVMASLALKEDL